MAKGSASVGTARNRVRFLGSARSGTADAWAIRVTSVMLVPLSIAFVSVVLSLLGKDHAAVRAELGHPIPAILMLFFILATVFHMKLGMQVIIEDYVHDEKLKVAAIIANIFFAIAVAAVTLFAILKLSSGVV